MYLISVSLYSFIISINNSQILQNTTFGTSEEHSSILDEIVAISSLNDGVNPGVESGECGNLFLDFLKGTSIFVEILGFSQEVGSKTLMGV